MLTAQELREIEERAEKATEGPWHWSADDYSMATLSGPDELGQHVVSVSPCKSCQAALSEADKELGWKWGSCTTPNEENASFIAHARTDIPALLADRKALVGVLRPFAEAARLGEVSGKPPFQFVGANDYAAARAILQEDRQHA